MRDLSLVIACLSVTACISGSGPKFADQSRPEIFEPIDKILTVHCHTERAEKDILARGIAGDYQFRLSPTCSERQRITQSQAESEPVSVMFVVDLTASMQPNIDALKAGILTLSRSLAANGWDARFGAVGFRDGEAALLTIPFGDANQLFTSFGDDAWQAAGGGDYQEDGQLAIQKGMELLVMPSAVDTRDVMRHVLIYISNAPAYVPGDPLNFSTEQLATSIREKADSLRDFRFYYSVDSRYLPEGVSDTIGAPMPDAQMAEFSRQLGLTSKQLYYPLSTKVLNDFSQEFQQISYYRQLSCYLTEVAFISDEGQGIPGKDRRTDIIAPVERGDLVTFVTSPDPDTTQYTMTLTRCCKYVKTEASCIKEYDATVHFDFVP